MSEILNQLQSMLSKMSPLLKNQRAPKNSSSENDKDITVGEKNETGKVSTPFQEKVEASQAKIVRNNIPASHDQSNAALLNPTKPKIKSSHSVQNKSKSLKKSESNNRIEKQDRSNEKVATNNVKPNDNKSDSREIDSNKINDSKTKTALKARLKKMDIDISDEQLNDPAFLKQMLKVAEAMTPTQGNLNQPKVQTTGDEETSDTPANEVNGNVNVNVNTQNLSSPTDLGLNATPVNEENLATEKIQSETVLTGTTQPETKESDLASLIKDRISELTKPSVENVSAQNSPNNLNENLKANQRIIPENGWNGIQNSSNGKSTSLDAMPIADLDKLRVIQASAINSADEIQKNEIGDLSAVDHLHTSDEARDVESDNTQSWSEVLKNSPDSQDENHGMNQNSNSGFGNPNQSNRELASQAAPNSDLTLNSISNVNNGAHNTSGFHQVGHTSHFTEIKTPVENVWSPHQPHIEKNILDQIAKKLNGSAHLNGEEISIQLDPENLGKVHIGLGLKDGLMNARIGVENEHVKKIVEDNLQTLRDSLESQGIKIQGMEVNVEQRHTSLFNPDGSNSQMFFHRHDQSLKNGDKNNVNTNGLEIAPESETGRRLGYNTMEYIA